MDRGVQRRAQKNEIRYRGVESARSVSTAGPEEESIRAASGVVWQALAARRRW